ncbi:MAG: fibronectin type III domain-containing protein [Campylobacterales bacterium]|nr:fibronectin type III domain-containing protein [Campylobacterales bacterium]
MKNILLTMMVALAIIGCGGGSSFSGGLPTELNDNATTTNDNSTAIVDNNESNLNDNATAANKAPLLEDYIEHFIDTNKITLFWKEASDSDGVIAGYLVSYRVENGQWSQEYPSSVENYAFFLDYNQSYQFKIRAVDDRGAMSSYIYTQNIALPSSAAFINSTKTYRAVEQGITLYLLNDAQKIQTQMQIGTLAEQKSVDWVDRSNALLVNNSYTKMEKFADKRDFSTIIDETKDANIELQAIIHDIAKVSGQKYFRLVDSRFEGVVYEFGLDESGEIIEIIFPILDSKALK